MATDDAPKLFGIPVRPTEAMPPDAFMLSTGPLVWVEVKELKTEVARWREALQALVGDEDNEPWAPIPYDDSGYQHCFFCGADYGSHADDCAWVAAKALLAEE